MTNKSKFLATLVLIVGTLAAQANPVKVTMKSPGTLAAQVGEANKYAITDLTIVGGLNGTDLRFLREMAGSDYNQKPTAGKLRRIDLSEATFVKGGEAYIFKVEAQTLTTGADIVPRFLLRGCMALEEIILPAKAEYLDTGAIEWSGVRRVVLPENVIVSDWVFNECAQLEEVVFPQHTTAIKSGAFQSCPKLKRLVLNDVDYISGYGSIMDMPALESIEVKGYLGFINGKQAICRCPKLRRIDFYDLVLNASCPNPCADCPQLETIAFHGPVIYTNFGKNDNCPLFKGYTTESIVVNSRYPGFIKGSSTSKFKKNPLYAKMPAQMDNAVQRIERTETNEELHKYFAGAMYDVACVYSLAGEKAKALDALEFAVNCGYSNYAHMKKNNDFANVRNEARFAKLMKLAQQSGDYLYILQHAPAYEHTGQTTPTIHYAPSDDADLVRARQFFNLDSIAGSGDEISRIKNIMYWLHDQIPHDGQNGFPDNTPRDAIDLFKACKAQKRGLNCRGLALVLNECYLAMGFPSRFVTCLPKGYKMDTDCHVINMVWSATLNKWIWMDPSFAAYVTDENGLLLHAGEVRERLIDGRPLVLNKDANWNHDTRWKKKGYLKNYMPKNLYFMQIAINNIYGAETDWTKQAYITLGPKGEKYDNNTMTSDDKYFWTRP